MKTQSDDTNHGNRKTFMRNSQLVLVLLLIGWEIGPSFFSQSPNVVMHNQSKNKLLLTLKWKLLQWPNINIAPSKWKCYKKSWPLKNSLPYDFQVTCSLAYHRGYRATMEQCMRECHLQCCIFISLIYLNDTHKKMGVLKVLSNQESGHLQMVMNKVDLK